MSVTKAKETVLNGVSIENSEKNSLFKKLIDAATLTVNKDDLTDEDKVLTIADITIKLFSTISTSENYDDFVAHPKNRKIYKDHVATLREIIRDKDSLSQIWYPIFVIKNYENIQRDKDTYIPKFVNIDGQHRFESFKAENEAIVFCDLEIIFGDKVKDPDFVRELVDRFNIGVKSYTKSETRKKRMSKNGFLSFIEEETKNMVMNIHNDKNMRKERVLHNRKGYSKKQFTKVIPHSWIEKSIPYIAKKHSKTNYMSKLDITKEERVDVRKAINYSKCFINGLHGHFPPNTNDAHTWINYMVKNIKGTGIDVNFYNKLSTFLSQQVLNQLNIPSIQTIQDLQDAVQLITNIGTPIGQANRKSIIEQFIDKNYRYSVSEKRNDPENQLTFKSFRLLEVKAIE